MRATFFAVIYIWIQLQSLVQGRNSGNMTKRDAQDSGRRILYGNIANVSMFPYMVQLNFGDSLCGGSIISKHWVISAAHCSIGKNCESTTIRAAVWGPRETVSPIECHNHPQFEPVRYTYDISLFKMEKNLIEDGRAKIIPMPCPGTRYDFDTLATILGWGRTEENFLSSELLFAMVSVKEWEWCNLEVKAIDSKQCKGEPDCIVLDIPKRTVCIAGQGSEASGANYGDSGGPLIINGELLGIFSHLSTDEKGKVIIGTPSMYTSVVDFLPWISSFVTPDLDTSGYEVIPED